MHSIQHRVCRVGCQPAESRVSGEDAYLSMGRLLVEQNVLYTHTYRCTAWEQAVGLGRLVLGALLPLLPAAGR